MPVPHGNDAAPYSVGDCVDAPIPAEPAPWPAEGGAGGDATRGTAPLPLLAAPPPTPYVLRVAAGEASGPVAGGIRAGLRVLSWIYLGATTASGLAHRAGLLRREHAPCPVIGIGNLTVGGTGKSTITAEIARWVRDAGLRPAILSRGYGARGAPEVRIVSDGERVLLDPDDGGDEPVMLARQVAGVPVLIGRRRPITARAAVERFGANVCLLDDGFQVWNLAKALEIALLDSARPFDNGFVLPRGMLREGAAALGRADAVILMEPQRAHPDALAALRRRVRELAPSALLAEAHRTPSRLCDLATGAEVPLGDLQGLPVVALSAIGNPGGFEELLGSLGARVFAARLRDHHPYSSSALQKVAQMAQSVGAAAIVTTDKDAVKLARYLDGTTSAGRPSSPLPHWVLSIRLRFTAGEGSLHERVLAAAAGTPPL